MRPIDLGMRTPARSISQSRICRTHWKRVWCGRNRGRSGDGQDEQGAFPPELWKSFALKAKWSQASDDAAPVVVGLQLVRRGKLIFRGYNVVYVWEPDVRKLWPTSKAVSPKPRRERRQQATERQPTTPASKQTKARPGAKPQYDREKIKAEIRTRQKSTAPEMVEWCKANGLKPPGERQMARYIAAVSKEKTKQT